MNLFICLTNLHLLIAKAIIEKENLYEVDVIFIGDSENRKNKNYISQISPYVRNIKIYPNYKNSSSFKTIKRTLYTKKIMASYEKKYDIVHFANFHIPIIHHILSLIKFNKIRTFDDGTHNINKMSIMYAKEKIKKHKLFIRNIMGRKYHKNDILRLIEKRYTIFPGRDNIVENTEYIELITTIDQHSNKKKKVINILLGTVYIDAVKEKKRKEELIQRIQKFIINNNIDFYIPHPRDDKNYFQKINVIDSEKIAEEEIISFIKNNYYVNLYGFNTTVQFNLDNVESIKNFSIKSDLFKDSFNNTLNFNFTTVTI